MPIAIKTAFDTTGAMYKEWLRKGLQQPGKSNVGLAKALGIDASGVSRMLKGERRLQLHEVEKAAAYLGIKPPHYGEVLKDGAVAPARNMTHVVALTKIAAGGVWREVGVKVRYEEVAIPLIPEPSLAGLTQYATRIDGTDFNKILRPGDYAIFVPYADIRKAPVDGDIVEVERRRGDMVETTVRRVRVHAGEVELWPESDDPAWQKPLRGSDGEIEITGYYVGLFRPSPTFARRG